MKAVRIVLTPHMRRRAVDVPTTFHVYLVGGINAEIQSEVDIVKDVWDGKNEAFKYAIAEDKFPLPASTVLAIDCFMEEKNRHGNTCQQRVGSASFPMRHLWEVGQSGLQLPLVHESSRLEQGRVRCRATFEGGFDAASWALPEAHEWSKDNQQGICRGLDDYVNQEMSVFKQSWQPSHPFLRRVHAPLHYSRTTIVPGIAFWMTGPDGGIKTDEGWCEHWLEHVATRHEREIAWYERTIVSQFEQQTHLHQEFRECCSMILEAACSVINSFEYISDWVPDIHGKKVYCESFDEIFVRKSGDCEDGSKGITEILQAFRDGQWERPLMQQVQRVCRLYVDFGMLGMVDAPTIRHGVGQKFQAHMFMNWVPIHHVENWLKRDRQGATLLQEVDLGSWRGTEHQPWMDQLEILNGEGTGHVQPNIVPYLRLSHDQQRLESHFQNAMTPPFLDRMLRPSWLPVGAPHRTFYKMHVHAYTNAFIKRGINVGAFTFFNQTTNQYGVPYDSVMSSKETISIRPHVRMSESLMKSMQSILALEHPMPHLHMKNPKPPWKEHSEALIEARTTTEQTQPSEANEWLRKLLVRWIPTTVTSHPSVWTDIYIHPSRMSNEQGVELQHYISKLGVRYIQFFVESDPNCVELCGARCRFIW